MTNKMMSRSHAGLSAMNLTMSALLLLSLALLIAGSILVMGLE